MKNSKQQVAEKVVAEKVATPVVRRQQVRELMQQGEMSPTTIAKTIGTHMSYVARLKKEILAEGLEIIASKPVVETIEPSTPVVEKPKAQPKKKADKVEPVAKEKSAKKAAPKKPTTSADIKKKQDEAIKASIKRAKSNNKIKTTGVVAE